MSSVIRCLLRPRFVSLTRNFATSEKLVEVTLNEETEISTVTLQRPPVNSLNLELLKGIEEALDSLEKTKSRGMILTSSSPTIFSAGLDILEMYKPKPDRVKDFWTTLQSVWLKLYSSSFPTVAAINGHSPAGGCLLALSCEYRVMVGPNYKIGLNETQLGIVAPRWFMDSMRNVIGERQTEMALTAGSMFNTEEALKLGLIDEIATDKADAIARSEKFLSRFERIPPVARSLTKQGVRQDSIERLVKGREKDLANFLKFVNMPQVQQGLEMYMAMLKGKKA